MQSLQRACYGNGDGLYLSLSDRDRGRGRDLDAYSVFQSCDLQKSSQPSNARNMYEKEGFARSALVAREMNEDAEAMFPRYLRYRSSRHPIARKSTGLSRQFQAALMRQTSPRLRVTFNGSAN